MESPETSFSSNDGCRKLTTKTRPNKKTETSSALPSPPQQPNTESDTDSFNNNVDEDVADIAEHTEQDNLEKDIDRAYQTVWDAFCGLPTEDCPTFQLRGQQFYEELYCRFQQRDGLLEYFEDSIRADWNASTGLLTLRLMPGPVHDTVQENIVIALHKELDRIAKQFTTLTKLRNNIITAGHANIEKKKEGARAPYFLRNPDGQFQHAEELYPPFIIEVAHSQSEEKLLNRVHEIFMELPGSVCTVLAIEIDYESPNTRKAKGPYGATYSLWVTEQNNEDVVNVIKKIAKKMFRNADGQALPGDLVLPFELFLPLHKRSQITAEAEARVSFATLSTLVDIGEKQERVARAGPSSLPLPRPKKIRFLDAERNMILEADVDVGPPPKRQQTMSPLEQSGRRTANQLRGPG